MYLLSMTAAVIVFMIVVHILLFMQMRRSLALIVSSIFFTIIQ